MSLSFASIIVKMIIKREKAVSVMWNNQTAGELP